MIALVLGNVASSRKMLALVRDCIAAYDAPAAYIDVIDGMRFDPVSSMKFETAEALQRRLIRLVDLARESGAQRIVLPVPSPLPGQPGLDLSRLAFWLKRSVKEPVYKLDVDAHLRERAIGTWSPDVLEISLRQMAKSLGPRMEVKAWEPEPPRHETERLTLTWPTEAQIEGYYQAIIGSDIFKTLLWQGPSSPADLHDYWLGRRQEFARGPAGELSLAAIERGSGEMIGSGSVRPFRLHGYEHGVWDLGYALAQRWHGRGYGTEFVGALTDLAFRDRGAQRVFADAFEGNLPSRRVLEKNGFVLEGTCRSAISKPDGRLNEWKMAIVRADWESRGR